METNTVETMLDTAAQTAPQQPEQPAAQPAQDIALKLRAQELITQARTIQAVAQADVFAIYNTDAEIRTRILNGEMDFIDTEMLVTLVPREDGTWYIASHEIYGRN